MPPGVDFWQPSWCEHDCMEFQQQGYRRSTIDYSFLDLEKGNNSEPTDTIISEVAIRSMYDYYRKVMGFEE